MGGSNDHIAAILVTQLIHSPHLRVGHAASNKDIQSRALDLGCALLDAVFPRRIGRLAQGSSTRRFDSGYFRDRNVVGCVWIEGWVQRAVDLLLDNLFGFGDIA